MDQWNTENPTSGSSSDPAVEHARRSLEDVRASAEELKARGSDAIRSSTARAREAISHTTDQATQYIQQQPLKALLMAAAAGAAIAMLAGLLSKSHHTH
jgi:ElaB/YqjD/DUF883 family membrane-anchored ribosome-binding protein